MADENEVPATKKSRGKPKVVKDWDEEDVFKLIAFVEGEPCLWNAIDVGYHNKIQRENSWRFISDSFEDKYSPADVNAKWTNLRIQYRGYAARAKTKSGQGAVEAPKWKFFNAMSFVGRAEDQQTETTTSNICIEPEVDSNSFEYSIISTPPPAAKATSRRLQVGNMQTAATQIADTMRDAVSAMRERNHNVLEPNTSFANYLLSELKTLSDEAAASVRKQVTLFFLECVENERKPYF